MRSIDAEAILVRAMELLQTGKMEHWEFDAIIEFLGDAMKRGESWISMEDRLPDGDGNFIVTACDEGCPAGEGIWYDTVVVVAEYYHGSWTWYEGGSEWSLDGIVTHWMPLPAPPEVPDGQD